MALVYDMTDTWNNIATTFTAIKMNVTDTNSAAASLLLDLQVGSTSQFNIGKTGIFSWAATRFVSRVIGQSSDGFYKIGQNGSDALYVQMNSIATLFFQSNNSDIRIINGSSGTLEWSSSSAPAVVGSIDLILARDAAGTLAQRFSTNAQAFRVYRTFTNSTNYERSVIDSNVFGFEIAGTGSPRTLYFYNRSNENIEFGTNNTGRWVINSSGHFLAATDNTYDIGNSSFNVRTVYTGTVQGGTNLALTLGGGTFTLSRETVTVGALQLDNQIRPNSIGTPMISELTIATGAITVTGTYHRVDTEGDAATDDLDTINGLGISGSQIILRAENDARTVVVKDGTGNIRCAGDFSLDNTHDTITLIFDASASAWLELSRSDNTA